MLNYDMLEEQREMTTGGFSPIHIQNPEGFMPIMLDHCENVTDRFLLHFCNKTKLCEIISYVNFVMNLKQFLLFSTVSHKVQTFCTYSFSM
jgi:hypothetical protein